MYTTMNDSADSAAIPFGESFRIENLSIICFFVELGKSLGLRFPSIDDPENNLFVMETIVFQPRSATVYVNLLVLVPSGNLTVRSVAKNTHHVVFINFVEYCM